MAAIFGKRKISWQLPTAHFSDTLWVENFDRLLYLARVKEIEAKIQSVI